MRKVIISLVPVLTVMLFGLSSCGTSTQVVSSWKSPDAHDSHLNKVLVLGMMQDRETKNYIETITVAELSALGVTAVTGTSQFGPRGFGDIDQEQVNALLARQGFNGILIVCLTAKDESVNYVPGSSYISPYGPTYYGYYGRYRYMWDRVYTPGYYRTSTTYVLDADMYSIPDDRLIYSAQTKSYDPSNSQDLARSFSEEIVRDLREQGII